MSVNSETFSRSFANFDFFLTFFTHIHQFSVDRSKSVSLNVNSRLSPLLSSPRRQPPSASRTRCRTPPPSPPATRWPRWRRHAVARRCVALLASLLILTSHLSSRLSLAPSLSPPSSFPAVWKVERGRFDLRDERLRGRSFRRSPRRSRFHRPLPGKQIYCGARRPRWRNRSGAVGSAGELQATGCSSLVVPLCLCAKTPHHCTALKFRTRKTMRRLMPASSSAGRG